MARKFTIKEGWEGILFSEDSKEEIALKLPAGETIYEKEKQWAFHMNAIDLIIYFKKICTPNGIFIAA